MKKINILIPDGDDLRAIKVVQRLGISGKTRVYIVTTKNNTVRYSRFCTPFFIPENADNDDINIRMKQVLKKYSIDIILPIAEKGIRYIHQNNWLKKWKTPPLPSENIMTKVGNKWKLDTISENLGIDNLHSILISKKSDIDRISNISHFPVLIKPVNGAGGYGIVFVNKKETLADHLAKLLTYNPTRQYLVQQYLVGSNMDISILCRHGKILAHTIQKPVHQDINSFNYAKTIQFLKNSKILKYCQKLVAHIKWEGVAHLDFIKEKSGDNLYLIDFNPRFWGTLMGSTLAGVNFPYLACLSAMDKNFSVPKYDHIEYYELNRIQMLSLIFIKKDKKLASIKNSTLYSSLLDPMPTIMKRPAVFR